MGCKLIGAVGCSGGTGDQDAVICKAGAEVVNSAAFRVAAADAPHPNPPSAQAGEERAASRG